MEQAVDAYVYLTFFALLYPPYLGDILLSLSKLLWLHHRGIRHLLKSFLDPILFVPVHTGFGAMELARRDIWNVLEDREEDSREQKLYKARARLERKLVLMPTGTGRCVLDDDQEEKDRMLANSREYPEHIFKRSLEGLLDKEEVPLEDEAQVERFRKDQFRGEFRGLYHSWLENAENPCHWMMKHAIPKYLRFALHRPLMSEDDFYRFLQSLGVRKHFHDCLDNNTPQNRMYRRLLKASVTTETTHPSTLYAPVLPRGQGHHEQPHTPPVHTSMPGQFGGGHDKLQPSANEDVSESYWASFQRPLAETRANICSTIKNFRRGGYALEEIEATICDHLKASKLCVKRYAARIEDPSFDPEKLASEIYTDALFDDSGDCPGSVGHGDDEEDLFDTTKEELEEMSNAITLFRRGAYTLKQAKKVIRDILFPLEYRMGDYVLMIKDHGLDASELASYIYIDALDETGTTQGLDDDEDSQEGLHAEGSVNLVTNADSGTPRTAAESLKLKFSSSSRLAAIFHDVLQGHLAVEEAPTLCRSALNKPDMSIPDLSYILQQNEIPSDMFFSREQITPVLLETGQSNSEVKHVEFDKKPVENRLTPAHSRESSIWFNTAAKPDIEYPDTPPLNPEDDVPPLERVSVLDQDITGKLTANRLPSATQKLAATPIVVDCLYKDDKDAEVPEPWYEGALEDSANTYGGEMQMPVLSCEALAEDWANDVSEEGEIKETAEDIAANSSPGELAMVSIETDDTKSAKSLDKLAASSGGDKGILNASKYSREGKAAEAIPSSSVNVIASYSLLPQPSAAPATMNATTVAQLSASRDVDAKLNGCSMGPPPVPENRTPMHRQCKDRRRGSFCATSSQPVKSVGDARQRSENSRSARSQVGYQQFAEAYIDLGSSSPENGETDDLHGIRMTTRNAQKLAFSYGLPRGFVETYVRSDTAERAANKKHLAARDVQFVPMLKRRRTVSPSEDFESKSAKFEEEIIPFADDHEDHISFMEHRMRSQGPAPDVAPELRCERCDCFPCLCRGRGRSPSPREFSQSKGRFRSSSLEPSSSPMGTSPVRKKRKSKSAKASQRGRQPPPRIGENAAQQMSVAWLLSAPVSPGENTNRLLLPFERSPNPVEEGFSKSTSEATLTSQHSICPPTPVHLPNSDRCLPPTPFVATIIVDTPMETSSTREVCRPLVLPQTPVNLPTSSTPPISMTTIGAGETLMQRIVAELAPIARKSLSQGRASRNDQDHIQGIESGLPFNTTEVQAKTDHQEITKAAQILQNIAKQTLSLLASPHSSGSEAPSDKSNSTSVPIPTRCETDLESKYINRHADTATSDTAMSNVSLEARKVTQELTPKPTSTPSRKISLSSNLRTLSLDRLEGPTVPIPCGIDTEAQENEGVEPVAPRNISISTSLGSLQLDNKPADGCYQPGSSSSRTRGPRLCRVLFSKDSHNANPSEISFLSTPIAPNNFNGRNATVNVNEIDSMDDDEADDTSSIDSVHSTPTKAQPVAVKVRELRREDNSAEGHTKTSISFQPGLPIASPRQLADDVMNQSASMTSSSPQPPPTPRPKHAVVNTGSAATFISPTTPRPGHKELNMGSMMKPLPSLQPPRYPQPTDLSHRDVLPSYAELTANLPSSSQHIVGPPFEMPVDYVEQVLARMENFIKRAERSSRRHRSRPQPRSHLPRAPKRPQDDLYERAWNEKVSAFVYLWQRRCNRQLANRDHSPDRYFSGVSASAGKSGTSTALNKVFDKYRGTLFPLRKANYVR